MASSTDIKVIFSPDWLRACVRVNAQLDPKAITRGHLLAALEEAKVAGTPALDARLDELCQLLQSGSLPGEDFLIAQGRAPTDPIDAQFEWSEALRPRTDGEDADAGRVSYYDRNTFVSVRQGDVIGRISPAKPGAPGVDVHGNPVHPVRKPRQIALRSNVEWAGDGVTVLAGCDGLVALEDDRISVASVLEIPGDVDYSTGHIDTPGDVVVHGSVKDLFKVHSARDITIHGHVDAAALKAGGNIIIHGGIHGHGKASIQAAGRVEARICGGATIEAGRILGVQRECINCWVRADRFNAPTGTIIGGYVWARNGIEVQTLGSPAHVRTIVTAGIPVTVIDQAVQMAAEIKEHKDGARKIREAVSPLLREIRRLSPQHRERATELMFQAGHLEQQAGDIDKQREQLLAQSSPDVEASVLVGGRIYPGVVIVVSGRATVVQEEIRGPVRIMERKIEGVTTLVAINTTSGSVRLLPTARFTAEEEKQAISGEQGAACATVV